MIFAAKHRKDRTRKLYEDEITSCVFGPLSFMTPIDVWGLFQVWLPFGKEAWPAEVPSGMDIDFWPNLAKRGRVEPDILIKFKNGNSRLLTVMIEVKWDSPISGPKELINQWKAFDDEEKENAFHVYLVRKIEIGHQDINRSLAIYNNKEWKKRLVCIGWRSLVETLKNKRPEFGSKMSLWADTVSSFLERKGQTVFTGFETLADETIFASENDLFWKSVPWFSMLDPVRAITGKAIFWESYR